jgi:dTDP-4-amino-4,6-dideoxygalactose transaminase
MRRPLPLVSIRNAPRRFLPLYSPWITDHELKTVGRVLQTNASASGAECCVRELEKNVAQYVGTRYGVGVSSPGAGLHAILKAIGIGAEDEVIVPTMAPFSVLRAVINTGARPALCDVQDDLTLSVESAARLVTLHTRAMICVHLGGQPCAMSEITDLCRRYRLELVEDASQALGASYDGRPVGTYGVAGVYALFPTDDFLNGDGAVAVTNDEGLSEKVRSANSALHMSGLQAAFGIHQLEKQELFIELRSRYAESYCRAFSDLPVRVCSRAVHSAPSPDPGPWPLAPGPRASWHLFTLAVEPAAFGATRNDLLAELHSHNIGAGVVVTPLHRPPLSLMRKGECGAPNPVFRIPDSGLPNAERLDQRIISLPLYARMTPSDVDDVITALCHVTEGWAQCRPTQGKPDARPKGGDRRHTDAQPQHGTA